MRVTARIALAAVLFSSAPLHADTPATSQWVVTSAKATGAGGNQYVTSVRIVNPNAVPAPVDITLFAASGDGSGDNGASPPRASVIVPANATLAIDDVLGTKFATVGAGGLRFDSTGTTPQGVWVLSQTLVVNALSSTGVPGTNGFAIPSQNADQLPEISESIR